MKERLAPLRGVSVKASLLCFAVGVIEHGVSPDTLFTVSWIHGNVLQEVGKTVIRHRNVVAVTA